jgi:hypothetical protein
MSVFSGCPEKNPLSGLVLTALIAKNLSSFMTIYPWLVICYWGGNADNVEVLSLFNTPWSKE